MGHADAEREASVANHVECQRSLGEQHRMLVLDRHHAAGHLDVGHFPQCHSENSQQIRVVRHLGHPDSPESLVAGLSQVADAGVHRCVVVQAGYQADAHRGHNQAPCWLGEYQTSVIWPSTTRSTSKAADSISAPSFVVILES